MKFNFKNKKVVAGFLSVVLLGFGVYDPALVGLGTELTCKEIKCDA